MINIQNGSATVTQENNIDYQARCDLAAAHRLAVMDGLNEGSWNHFSLVSPSNPTHMMITPGDTHWSQVRASNLAIMGPQAEMVSGPRKPNDAAWIIHYPLHRARKDAKCVLHAHTPYATALSARKSARLDTRSSQAAASFHDDVAYFDLYDGILRAEEEGERMAETLGGKRVLMMRNHGVVVTGESVGHAYLSLYLLERACQFQLLATGNGGHELNQIPEEVAAHLGRENRKPPSGDRHFQGMKEVLAEKDPGYVN